MAQFIQSNQLSPVQGGIGNQQVVDAGADRLPDLVNSLVDTADMAGQIYGEQRGQAIVDEEIENMDAAIAAAEDRAKAPAMLAKNDVPESIQMDQKQWDILSNAVRSGQMSQERARLIASSRVRSRIAEQPFYADRMRQSASSVLGFNIESEHARQYFASFPTQSQLGGGGNKYRQDKMNQAQAISEATGHSVDAVYKQLVAGDFAQERKRAAAAQMDLGTINAQQFTSEMLAANQSTAFGELSGEMRAFELEQGKPVDGVAFSRIVRERKQAFIEDFNDKWLEGKGALNTPEYNRAMEQIDSQYQQMEDFVMDFGIDNLTTVQLERAEQMREMMGNEFFPQMKLLTETFGQQVTSDVIELFSLNPTQRDLILSRNPELQRAYSMMNSDPAEFNKRMVGTVSKIMQGQELSQEDMPWVNHVASTAHSNGSPETKAGIIQGLAEAGAKWKSLSLLSEASPRLEPEENVAYYTDMYERELPQVITQLGTMLADVGANNYDFVVAEDGTLSIEPLTSAAARPSENLRNLQFEIDRINVFAKGFKKGWGREIPDTLDTYKAKLNSTLQQAVTTGRNTKLDNKEEEFLGQLESGNMRVAGRIYGELREEDPDTYDMLFDDFVAEMRRSGDSGINVPETPNSYPPTDEEMRRMQEQGGR